MKEKQSRLDFIVELPGSESLNVEAYKREMKYQAQGLTEDEKAQQEVNLLASTVRKQIVSVYQDMIESGMDHETAVNELKEINRRDLELADAGIRNELIEFSESIIHDVEIGVSQEVELKNSHQYFLKGVRERSKYFDELEEGQEFKSADFKNEYSSKVELLKELVDKSAGAFGAIGSSNEVRSEQALKADTEISLQVKMEYMGVTLEAGPQINFKRDYTTFAAVAAEGMEPFVLGNGNFDFWQRDFNGKIIKVKGKEAKRPLTFVCQTELKFATDYKGAGGFKFQGLGASASVTKSYSNAVNLTSRRVSVPEYIDNKSVTLKFLAELCHKDFLKTKITSNLTVSQALNVSMKNVVSGLRFSHPETKCAADKDCVKWYKQQKNVDKMKSTPRCVQSPGREKFFRCEARGHAGYSCPVYDKSGKRMSLGIRELNCEKGLRCVQSELKYFTSGLYVKYYVDGKCTK